MTAQAIAAVAIGTGYLVSTLDGADQPDRALRVFTNAELRREVGYVEGTGDWNRQTATELKFDFRALNPLESVRPISKGDDTLHFGPDQAGWCMGVSANIEPLGRLVVEVVLRNNTPEERFILGGGAAGERPFDLVAVGPAGETTLLGGARNVRSIGNWRIVARSIPAQSEAHWTLRFSESDLKGGTGEYVIYGLVSIPRGRHVRKESNGEFTTLMRQESIEVRSEAAVLPNLTGGSSALDTPAPSSRFPNGNPSNDRFAALGEMNAIEAGGTAPSSAVASNRPVHRMAIPIIIGLLAIVGLILLRAMRRARKAG